NGYFGEALSVILALEVTVPDIFMFCKSNGVTGVATDIGNALRMILLHSVASSVAFIYILCSSLLSLQCSHFTAYISSLMSTLLLALSISNESNNIDANGDTATPPFLITDISNVIANPLLPTI